MPQATVTDNRTVAVGLHLLTLDASHPGYTVPGQFVTAGVGEGKPAFFALASSPGEPLQLLIKKVGDMAHLLTDLDVGAAIEVSDPMGKGFDLSATAGRELSLLVNGSGISAARPVIRAEIAAGLSRPVNLFYGVLTPGHRAFLSDLEAWANAGVKIHTVLDPAGSPDWDGPTGFVQNYAKECGCIRSDSAVVLVGLPIMLDQAKALCAEAGMPENCVVTNF